LNGEWRLEGHPFAERPDAAKGKKGQSEQVENQERKERGRGAENWQVRG